jgi:hypothetical protein
MRGRRRTRADAGPSIGSEDGLDRKEYKTKDKECMKCEIDIQRDYYLKNGGGDKIKKHWLDSVHHPLSICWPFVHLEFPASLLCVSVKKRCNLPQKKSFLFLFSPLAGVRWFINTIIYRRRGRPRPTAGFTADGP